MSARPLKPGVIVPIPDQERAAARYVVALVSAEMRKAKVCAGDVAKFVGAASLGGYAVAVREAKRWVTVADEGMTKT